MITKLMDGLPNQSMAQGPFDAAVAKYMTELPAWGGEANALAADVNAKQVQANTSAASAAASVDAATAQVAAAQAARDAAVVARIAAQAAASDAHEAATGTVLTGTSATPLVIGTGNKTLATQAGKQYAANIFITAVSASDPTRFMTGTVASYSGTTLTIAVTAVGGNGDTKSDWNISVTGAPGVAASAALKGNATGAIELLKGAAPAASATPDIWVAGGNRVPISSSTTITGFPAAPQAGAQRTLVATVAFSITNGANLVIAGGSTALNPGDEIDITADTPTLFKAWVRRASSFVAATGDTLTTARSLPSPDWLLCDGSAYLQTSYPSLYGIIGNPLALTDLPVPATTQSSPQRCALTADATVMVVTAQSSATLGVYTRAGNVFTQQTGLTLPGAVSNVSFNADGSLLAVSHATAPFLTVYSRSGGVFTAVTGLPTFTTVPRATFSPDGTKIAVTQAASPYISVYGVSGTTFTKWPDTATPLSSTNVQDYAFSPDGGCLAAALVDSPFVELFSISGTTLTKLPPPSTLPAGGQGRAVAFDASSSTLAVAHTAFPYVTLYNRSANVFTKLADPSPAPVFTTGAGYCVRFDSSGKNLVLGGSLGLVGFIFYRRTGDSFSPVTQKITDGGGVVNWLTFSNNGRYMAAVFNFTTLIRTYSQSYDPATQFAVPTISVGAPTFIKT